MSINYPSPPATPSSNLTTSSINSTIADTPSTTNLTSTNQLPAWLLTTWEYLKFYTPTYYHYAFLSILAIISIILFLGIIFCHQRPKYHTMPKQQGFQQNLISWKRALEKMKFHYQTNHRLNKVKFYLGRTAILLLFIWLLIYLYQQNLYRSYIYYIQFIYLGVFIVEYFVLFNVLRTTISPNFNNLNHPQTALLIPLGGSGMEEKISMLDQVLPSALKTFNSDAIFILHNGKTQTPSHYQELKAKTDEYQVNYIYLPVPSKSYALYYCATYLCEDLTQCLIIDDDVILPDNFYLPRLTDEDAVGYPISAKVNSTDSGWAQLLTSFQNLEYGLSGLVKIVQSNWSYESSVLSHHGAIGLWKTEKLAEVMLKHDSVFHGEDLQMGVICYSLGYRMKMVDNIFVPTEPPKKIFGAGGLYRQRVWSWDYIILKYVPVYLKLLLNTNIFENIPLKIFILYELWTIFIDIQRYPVVIYSLYTQPIPVSIFILSVAVINIGIGIWFNYVIMINQEKNSSLISIIFFPIYKFILTFFRLFGELRYIFRYVSDQHRSPVRIKDMPLLPNIKDQINIEISELNWEMIWSDQAYLNQTVRRLDHLIDRARNLAGLPSSSSQTNSSQRQRSSQQSTDPQSTHPQQKSTHLQQQSNQQSTQQRQQILGENAHYAGIDCLIKSMNSSGSSNISVSGRQRTSQQKAKRHNPKAFRDEDETSQSIKLSAYKTINDLESQQQLPFISPTVQLISVIPSTLSLSSSDSESEMLAEMDIRPIAPPDPGYSPREERSQSDPPRIRAPKNSHRMTTSSAGDTSFI